MPETIALSKASFVKLLDSVLYPNPDDPGDPSNPLGPYGPIGPIIHWALRDLSSVLLNPGPLPWHAGPLPDPWLSAFLVRAEPTPVPWRSALLARRVIDQAVAQYRFIEASAGPDQAMESTRSYIREFVDGYCGTRPPRWPWPWPWPPVGDPAQLSPIDLLMAGAQFQKAADAMTENPMQTDFSDAADQLLEAGLRRMEGG